MEDNSSEMSIDHAIPIQEKFGMEDNSSEMSSDHAIPTQEKLQQQPEKFKLSCVKYIDSLWFCYSPFHQVREYYREGTFDNCRRKWSELFDCFHLKTLSEAKAQAILEQREKEKLDSHIWKFRTPDEASKEWKKIFGHFQDD